MGVPALFRWLSKKYPKIITPVVEEQPYELEDDDGTKTKVPIDMRKPNPNGEEFDNLYLDMNGIVHPCSHPEDRPPPANEEEMMIAIFEFTDRVVNMARPRKLLYIAVDGVAPRAKMNQQRSRRFRSAQEAAEKDKQTEEFHALLKKNGESGANGKGDEPKKTWDSNSITPGTPFMDLLAMSLRYWVRWKSTTDPAWEKLKIIISDASVPGEGEHKIMNFIRSQRSSGAHDPNTRHVFVGLDADLIMLGIATHEPHFRVLREDVFANDAKPGHCRKCNQPGHKADECRGVAATKTDEGVEKAAKPFIWLNVATLREYLAVEMHVPNQPFKFDLERALDDWVFMCFFVGNDFLPHLPSLDIREDGIDTLIAIWRDNIPVMGGYVTKDGHVDLERAQVILEGLAKQEDAIFKRRREGEVRRAEGEKRRAEQQERRQNQNGKRMRFSNDGNGAPSGFDESVIRRGARGGIVRGEAAPDVNALPTFAPGDAQTRNDPRYSNPSLTHADVVGGGRSTAQANKDNLSAAAALKEKLKLGGKPADSQKAEVEALFASNGASQESGDAAPVLGKRTRDMIDEANDGSVNSDPSTPGRNTPDKEIAGNSQGRGTSGALGGSSTQESQGEPEDTVRLWETGYQDRYYEQKFHAGPEDVDFRRQVARSYVEGLCWVLLYYFQGCPSWTWYFPYHYAPFAADFQEMGKMSIDFDKGSPFRPYEQLMGVMPPASNHTLPAVFHPLMTDEDSPIKEFYPIDFEVDLNGKKFAWQGVALLPFIDEKRLLTAMKTKYPLLTADEQRRNDFGDDVLVFSTKHPLYDEVVRSYYSKKPITSKNFKLDTYKSQGLSGKVGKDADFLPGSELLFPLESGAQDKFTSLDQDASASVTYHMPVLHSLHKSMLLAGVKFPEQVLDYKDVQQTREKAGKTGRSHGGVQLSHNGDRSDGRRIDYAARDSYRPPLPPPGVAPMPHGGLPPPPGASWNYPPGLPAMPAPPPSGRGGQYGQNGYGQYGSQQNHYGGQQGYAGQDGYRGYAPPPAPGQQQQYGYDNGDRGGNRNGNGGYGQRYGYENRGGGYGGGYDSRGDRYGGGRRY